MRRIKVGKCVLCGAKGTPQFVRLVNENLEEVLGPVCYDCVNLLADHYATCKLKKGRK